jgi:hypothetical protein
MMLREKRALALARRQAMIARHGKREAMRDLAESLEEERRKQGIAERTRALLQSYGAQSGGTSGEGLAAHRRFAGGLANILGEATNTHRLAMQQADRRADELGRADLRLKRVEEREVSARRALEAAKGRRDDAVPAALARKLQTRG